MNAPAYNFAYLDEQTKRMIRRAILKAIAVPGYQVPFASREMPMPYGWGTGGVQVTAAILGPQDVLKVIDQGADDTTNAVSIRKFFAKTAGVRTTTCTSDATVIQTRHRIPETPLHEGQILVFQVPIPEPLRFLEPRETETRQMHALSDYGLMHLKLYEDIARHGHIATTYAYPVSVAAHYVMDPSPIPKFDNPKMGDCSAPDGRRAFTPCRPTRGSYRSISRIIPSSPTATMVRARCAASPTASSTKSSPMTAAAACLSVPIPITANSAVGRARAHFTICFRGCRVNTGPELVIRKASEADLAGVLALYAQPELDDGVVLSVAEAAGILRRFDRYPDYALYVAEQAGRVVGSFALLIMDNLGHLGAPSAIVEDVVVDPRCHGSGIGRAMMQFAVDRCREKECYKLALSSNAKRVRAHDFYTSLGFERHGYSFRILFEPATA